MKLSGACLILLVLMQFINLNLTAQHVYRGKKNPLPDNRFRFGFIGGTTLGQIDGDYYVGFHKWGWYAGLKGEAILTKNMSLETNLALTESGSRFEPWQIEDTNDTREDREISLRYVEIPVLYKIRFPLGRLSGGIELGMSFMSLFSSAVKEDEISRKYLIYNELQDDFKSQMQSIVVGGEIRYERFSVSLRLQNGVRPFYVNADFKELYNYETGRYAVEKMRAYYISLLGAYTLFGDFSDR